MSNVELPLSNIINVTIQPSPQNLSAPNINTAAIFTADTAAGVDVYEIYTNATDVGVDFGTGSDTYKIAVAFFAQQPNPLNSFGYLVVVKLLSMEAVDVAIARTKNLVYYFGVLVTAAIADTPLQTLADYMQTVDKMLFYCSATASDMAAAAIFDDIRVAGDVNTRCLYYHTGTALDSFKFAAAYASRALSTYFAGSNTTQTMNLKQLTTITPDQTLTETLYTNAQAAGVDIYPSNAGVPGLLTSGANGWFDEIYNQFWFKFALQTAGFNYLATTSTKIPQTEPGMTGLKNVYRQVCAQAVVNGFIAPGTWNSSDTFGPNGDLVRNIVDVGYYVYSLPISQQSQDDREDRIAPLCQIAVKAAGAIQKSSVIVNVNL